MKRLPEVIKRLPTEYEIEQIEEKRRHDVVFKLVLSISVIILPIFLVG